MPPETPRAIIVNSDVRGVDASAFQTDAVLTSPPYPGVYDYLSFARKVKSGSGSAAGGAAAAGAETYFRDAAPGDRNWPAAWTTGEVRPVHWSPYSTTASTW